MFVFDIIYTRKEKVGLHVIKRITKTCTHNTKIQWFGQTMPRKQTKMYGAKQRSWT